MMPFPLLIHNISGIIIITISKITNTTSTITSIGILTTTATVVNDDYDHDDHDNPHDHDDHDHLPRLLPSSQNGSDPSHLPCGGRVTHSPGTINIQTYKRRMWLRRQIQTYRNTNQNVKSHPLTRHNKHRQTYKRADCRNRYKQIET